LEGKGEKHSGAKGAASVAAVEPKVIQTVLLDEIAGRLAEIQEFLSRTEPRGLVAEWEEKVGWDVVRIDFVEEFPYTPLFSATFYNQGLSRVYVAINEGLSTPFYLEPEDRQVIDFKFPKLRLASAWCDVGEETVLKVVGVY